MVADPPQPILLHLGTLAYDQDDALRSGRQPRLYLFGKLEQKAVIRWFRLQYRDALIFAIPNGGQRHIAVAAKLKAEGVLPGIPDLCIINENEVFFVEMKTVKGKLSTAQKEMIGKLSELGIITVVGYGFEDAKIKIEKRMKYLED